MERNVEFPAASLKPVAGKRPAALQDTQHLVFIGAELHRMRRWTVVPE